MENDTVNQYALILLLVILELGFSAVLYFNSYYLYQAIQKVIE
jgi:hypothetical protein